jgi:hypothetical protein
MIGTNIKALFISHTWTRNQPHWKKVVDWFEREPDFQWKNCSSPDTETLADRSSRALSEEMTRQIASAQAVIILSEMYAANSDWVDYEISEAKRLKKFIIGVAPLEQGSIPRKIREAADLMVGGSRISLIGTIRVLV